MRSVLVHLVDAPPDEVRSSLDSFARPQDEAPWIYPPNSELPALYISFLPPSEESDPEEVERLTAALRRLPELSVIAEVSGRVPGDKEALAFVEMLLMRFKGVAEDDITDHCWTLEEIRSGTDVSGHRFFDYKGSYENSETA